MQWNPENKIGNSQYFSVYPNPTEDALFISLAKETKSSDFIIVDIFGRNVKTVNQLSSGERINISDLANGTYILIDQNNRNNSIKFLKH